MSENLGHHQRKHFRDELRSARAEVLRDAEAFDSILFAIERLGQIVAGKQESLHTYREKLSQALFAEGDRKRFERVAGIVKDGRNNALHQGAAARHLAQNCVAMALMLEDRLSERFMQVSDFMVSNPVCAFLWQPLSHVRQAMLAGSFSFLPFMREQEVLLISDTALVRYLRDSGGKLNRERLSTNLSDALQDLRPVTPSIVFREQPISEILPNMSDVPAVVMESGSIVGIVTAFDLL